MKRKEKKKKSDVLYRILEVEREGGGEEKGGEGGEEGGEKREKERGRGKSRYSIAHIKWKDKIK